MGNDNYKKLSIILAISFFIMYAVMFLDVDSTEHIYFSLSRLYIALLMISPIAMVIVSVMRHLFTKKRVNKIVYLAALCIFLVSFSFLRNQTFTSDKDYLRAMISRQSSAIMTSKNASIMDVAVRDLASDIIQSREKEIKEMKELLKKHY